MKTKALISVLLLIILSFTFVNISNAIQKEINPATYKPSLTTDDYKTATEKTVPIVNAITTVGMVVSVVMAVVLGIKYMLGSAEQKADYKNTMMPVIIGVILIFFASVVVRVIVTIVNPINNI